jgi:hypothetical protein
MRRAVAIATWTLLLGAVAGSAAAQSSPQPQISRRAGYFTFGGSLGADPGNDTAILDLAADVEAPLTSIVSVRGQIGRAGAEVTSMSGPIRISDTLRVRRFTASLQLRAGSKYVFGGVGAYQYRYAIRLADDKTRWGTHIGGGVESPPLGVVVLNAEVTLRRVYSLEKFFSPMTLSAGFKIRY